MGLGTRQPGPLSGCSLSARPARLLDSAHAGAPVPPAAPIPELPGPRSGRPEPGPGADAVGTRSAVPVAATALGRRRRQRRRGRRRGRGRGRGAACALPARAVRAWRPPSLSRPPGARAALRPFTSHLLPFPSRSRPHRPSHVLPVARACVIEPPTAAPARPLVDTGHTTPGERSGAGRGGAGRGRARRTAKLGQSLE